MKQTIIALITTFALSGSDVYAQFNTIRERVVRYKVEVISEEAEKRKEATHVSDTSQTKGASAVDALQQQEPIKTAERTKHTIGVSYPLRNIVVTSPYGYRRDPFTGKRTFHNGIDLRANFEPVYSMLPGEVIQVGHDKRAGIYITIQTGYFTITYCHLSNVLPKKKQFVKASERIGISGSTGRSTGPHLHITCKDRKQNHFNPLVLLYQPGVKL